ncbi:helix-turn-helix transcriptional regulator [Streptomyces sp. NPDC051776]|uniref:helix-turn-helix domain-containing protein n=1 Tax=Streptomyces sp. NPDC051776 TaxID=3155414 RepID=UPI003437ED4B
MPDATDDHIGARIAEQRKLAHLTQRGLAQKAHVSFSLLSKVESGHRPASPAIVAACARALGIESSVLVGQPYAAEQRADRFDAPMAAIRASLENWDVPLDSLTPPRPLEEIVKDVQGLGEDRRRADYLKTAAKAPALIDELVEAAHRHEGTRQERAHRLLAYTYRCVHDVAYKLGHIDLGSSVLVRMSYSADRSGDPYMVILNSYLRAQSCFNTGRHDVGLRLMERSLAEVEENARRGDTSALCVQGNLRLRATMLAARQRPGDKEQAETARAQWREAWDTASQLGGDTQNYVMSFGPSNTLIHKVALEVELGNYGRAVKDAEDIHLPEEFGLAYPDRVSHYFIDLSRAQLWTGDRQGAFASLLKARAAAPQQTKFHPHVRETMAALRRADRESGESLLHYARWLGL